MSPTTTHRQAIEPVRTDRTAGTAADLRPCADADLLPLTAALLEVSSRAVSFATPGHRAGRSCAIGTR